MDGIPFAIKSDKEFLSDVLLALKIICQFKTEYLVFYDHDNKVERMNRTICDKTRKRILEIAKGSYKIGQQ